MGVRMIGQWLGTCCLYHPVASGAKLLLLINQFSVYIILPNVLSSFCTMYIACNLFLLFLSKLWNRKHSHEVFLWIRSWVLYWKFVKIELAETGITVKRNGVFALFLLQNCWFSTLGLLSFPFSSFPICSLPVSFPWGMNSNPLQMIFIVTCHFLQLPFWSSSPDLQSQNHGPPPCGLISLSLCKDMGEEGPRQDVFPQRYELYHKETEVQYTCLGLNLNCLQLYYV